MRRCNECGLYLGDDQERCPLCKRVIGSRAEQGEREVEELRAKVERRDKRLRELRAECDEFRVSATAAEDRAEEWFQLALDADQKRDSAIRCLTLVLACLCSAEEDLERERDRYDQLHRDYHDLDADRERVTADWVALRNECDELQRRLDEQMKAASSSWDLAWRLRL